MRSSTFYKQLSELNCSLYNSFGHDFNGWSCINTNTTHSGVNIALYDVGHDEVVFAIRGTQIEFSSECRRDLIADGAMYLAKVPRQYKHAEQFYIQIKNMYPTIIFTGYSLGGSIAQMLGAKYGNEAICFEPIGTRGLQTPIYETNIINFGNTLDPFFLSKLKNQVGQIYIMPVGNPPKLYPKQIPNPYWHYPQNYGDPQKAEKYKLIRDRATDYLKSSSLNTFNHDK